MAIKRFISDNLYTVNVKGRIHVVRGHAVRSKYNVKWDEIAEFTPDGETYEILDGHLAFFRPRSIGTTLAEKMEETGGLEAIRLSARELIHN